LNIINYFQHSIDEVIRNAPPPPPTKNPFKHFSFSAGSTSVPPTKVLRHSEQMLLRNTKSAAVGVADISNRRLHRHTLFASSVNPPKTSGDRRRWLHIGGSKRTSEGQTEGSTNFDIEAVKLDHARQAWPLGSATGTAAGGKVGQDGGRRQSISSEESLSDCEELGGMSPGGLVEVSSQSEKK
jgi:hypothetical protein